MRWSVSALFVAVLLGGCASEVVPEEASLELGTGTWRFEPVADGDAVPLIRGAQGGWHVWVAVRTNGMERDRGSLSIALSPADESRPPRETTLGVTLDPPDAEGRRVYLGWPAILDDPSCAVGELLRIEATFTDATGRRVTVERDVMVTGGDDPPPPCE